MLTVGDLLRDLEVRLLAGERGLHLPVRWVHISELLDPTPWLSGGELLLTTGMQLDTPAQAREFAARLADHHLAGLGFGTGFKHATVPEPLLEVAAERPAPDPLADLHRRARHRGDHHGSILQRRVGRHGLRQAGLKGRPDRR